MRSHDLRNTQLRVGRHVAILVVLDARLRCKCLEVGKPIPESSIQATSGHERRVGAPLGDASLVHNVDLVRKGKCAQAMGDHDHGMGHREQGDPIQELALARGVNVGRNLVEDVDGRVS